MRLRHMCTFAPEKLTVKGLTALLASAVEGDVLFLDKLCDGSGSSSSIFLL